VRRLLFFVSLGALMLAVACGGGGSSSSGNGTAAYPGILDSGSNGIYFLDTNTTGIPICSDDADFYCPSGTTSVSATNQGWYGSPSVGVSFSVANADNLFNTRNIAFNNLAGPSSGEFDFGLPFFFGRNVYTAIETKNTPGGIGPYFAYTGFSASTGSNVQPIQVYSGPAYAASSNPDYIYTNGLFTSVTVCMPSAPSTCQTITGVLVDTGSVGLRILSSALTSIALPLEQVGGNAVTECTEFMDGYTYGSVRTANVQLAGTSETASSVPIQLIGDPAYSSVPASCVSTGLVAETTLSALGANAVLGVGPFLYDCDTGCTQSVIGNPVIYYTCPSATGCTESVIPQLQQQVTNPVALLPTDNNGVIIELPSISSSGASVVNGFMVFGIGTASNNGLNGATVFPLGSDANNFNTNGAFVTIY